MGARATIDAGTREFLAAYGFDEIPFDELAGRLEREGFDPERNRLRTAVTPLAPDDVQVLPEPGSAEGERLAGLGREALRSGRVAAVVLNGGMASRFGGVVKGTVTAVDGRSFLELKLRQIEAVSAGRAPALLMNSFATHEATARHLAERGVRPGRAFLQFAALRLNADGSLFRDAAGRPSPYATGHGDLPFALVRSGEAARLRRDGVRWLTVSNVDNLGASLDPRVLGLHIAAGRPMSVEAAPRLPDDAGGVIARVGGRATVVEAFRLPVGFDPRTVRLFNTNTFVFDLDALARPVPLEWFPVRKDIDGVPTIQFERLLGQLADHLPATWIEVPRSGPGNRFLPVKVPADLERQESALREVLRAQGLAGDDR